MTKQIKHTTLKLIDRLKTQSIYVAIFAASFSLIGWALPHAYYEFFDNTKYLIVRYPMGTDKEQYAVNDKLILISTYTALIDLRVTSYNDWNRVNDDGSFTKVIAREKTGVFTKAAGEPFSVELVVPEVSPGTYFISGIKEYTVRGTGREYAFITEPFEIK